MASVNLIALARPTFDVEVAQRNFELAQELLKEIGADLHGPKTLIMTPDDVANAKLRETDYYILFMASFSDASPAVDLLAKVKGPILLWSVREPGAIGERRPCER